MRDVISLYYKSGSSDKVYHAQLQETLPGKWSCLCQYGRRGGTLNNANKVVNGSYREAREAYDKIVDEKIRGGYERGALAGLSAVAAPPVSAPPAPAAVKLPPLPSWSDLELAYAEVATFFSEPATLKTAPQAWMVLMVDLAAGAQEGLPDAVKQVKRASSDADVERMLSDDAKTWYEKLTPALQSASLTLMRNSCKSIR